MILDDLKKRGFDPDKYHCWVDEEANEMTVPLFRESGKWVGVQKYRPHGIKKSSIRGKNRYDTYGSEEALWGFDTIPDEKCTVFVTEAVFRACALHRIGLNAIAMLGSTCSKKMTRYFKEHKKYNFVWVGDPDDSGKKAVKYFNSGLVSPKDLDEMSMEELLLFKDELVGYIK